MDALIPMLSVFMQSTCLELEEREQAAVNAHMAQSSEPPWFVDGRGPNHASANFALSIAARILRFALST